MGRRSRSRAQATGEPAPRGSRPGPTRSAPRAAGPRLDAVKRTLIAYLGAAAGLSVLTLAGIVVLGGTLGPFITLAVVAVSAGLLHRAVAARLAGAELTDEDRMMQTLAGGMLVLCVVLAAAGVLVTLLA